jgi:hypothetical protein
MNESTRTVPHKVGYGLASITLVLALIFILIASYSLFRPAAMEEGVVGGPKIFMVNVSKTAPGTPTPVFQLREGESAQVMVHSKVGGMLMVHGFPDMPDVTAGQVAVFSLNADKTGRFSLHLHTADGSQIELATIEIRPRN